ncbi:histidine phosphatase family protein [Longispora sp. NPDC051575]|uniref:histidine phosphatase family protein n=1 Tax=Longispora sp. NPDC051575 TaxID=3154943 RepID=UPI00344069F6
MAVSLVYETHAKTEDNEAGIATGWLPGRLSAFGRDAARALGGRHRAVDAVFTSDLGRAVETATLAFTDRPVPVYFDSRLRECDYGHLNGAPVAELDPRRARIDEPFPGGQSYRQVVGATAAFLQDLAARWDGRRVVVIAHSANRWALQHLLSGVPLEEMVDAPFAWRPGWEYTVPTGWTAR